MATGDTLPDLALVMERLLAPDGCPWDREQTLASLRPFLLEETYEVLEALDDDDANGHREELGDLLFQIVFQAALRQRAGAFDLDDVVRGIADKLRRRHPHVFAPADGAAPTTTPPLTSAQVLTQWSELKQKEKPRRTLEGVPPALPALSRAHKLSERAAQVGFDWPDASGSRAKISEELAELDHAIKTGSLTEVEGELGDLLFAIVNLARKIGVDPEVALRTTNAKFCRRFAFVEDGLEAQGKRPKDATLAEMDALWDAAKAGEPHASSAVTEK